MIRKIFRTILTTVLIAAVLISGYMLEQKLGEYRKALDIKIQRTTEMRKGRDVDFRKLKEQNPDVCGWIWLKDSNIDYPIVQGEDNDYYLHRDLDGNYLYDGTIFIDCTNDDPFNDFNTVIYGHRMLSGAMFADLKYYVNQDYMDSHKIIQIETPEQSYDLHVVAFCNELSDSDLYTTYFSEWMPDFDESDENESYDNSSAFTKEDFVSFVKNKAVVTSGEDFGTNDKFVTLSTCVYASGEERIQVIGKLEPPATKEKYNVTKTTVYKFNKWFVLQIVVWAVMAVVVLSPIVSLLRSNRKKKNE